MTGVAEMEWYFLVPLLIAAAFVLAMAGIGLFCLVWIARIAYVFFKL